MPIVQINMYKGISDEIIKKNISGITKVLTDIGIPALSVEIIVHEIPKIHWGFEGKPVTESLPDAKPPT